MAEIKDLNKTDASNSGTAANAGFAENMAYSDVNNAARALEGMIARWYADTNSTLDTAGSSNAYTLTPNRTVAAYARGDTYTVEASFTNTGAATINVSSLGAKSIVKPSGSAVASGDIQSGGIYTLVYDGTSFQMAGVDDPTTLSITTLTVSGVTTLNGNTVIGSDASDTVTINADVASNVLPSADNTYDLGASGSEWKDLYIDGIAYVDTLNADSVDIDGGSIDGTTIGASSAAAATFTTISGTTITASTSLKTPLIEYTDGDDAITIADGGGVTIADLTATTADINGGTFDGIVGGTTPAAGSFTTLSASTSITGTLATAAQANITSVGTLTGLTVTKASSGATPTGGTVVTIEDDDNAELSILGGSSSLLAINFGHSGDADDGIITYNTTSGSEAMGFTVNASNRMTIDKDGDVSVAANATGAARIKGVSGDQDDRNAGGYPQYTFVGNEGTGMRRVSANTLAFDSGGDERMRITDSTHNHVVIGSTSVTDVTGQWATGAVLDVHDSGSSNTGNIILSNDITTNGSGIGSLVFANRNNSNAGADTNTVVSAVSASLVTSDSNSGDDSGGYLRFLTKLEAGSISEKMRIASNGTVSISRTESAGTTDHGMDLYSSGHLYIFCSATGNGDTFRSYNGSGTLTASIEADGDYIDHSDENYKSDITDASSVLSTISDIKIRSFTWKESGRKQSYGFVAQELKDVVPEATKVPEEEGDMWGVRNSRIVPMLTKAIQEQQALIETLQTKVKALEEA